MNDDLAPYKIGLFGPYGWGNLGDAAIQEAVIQHIRHLWPNAEIHGFSLNPADTERRHHIPSHPLYRWYEPYRRQVERETQTAASESSVESAPAELGVRQRLKGAVKSNPLTRPFFQLLKKIASPIRDALDELRFLRKSYRNLRTFDLLVISGGGQLEDFWGGARRQPFTLFKFSLMARLAHAGPVYLSVGTGRTESRASRFFFRNALRLAPYRSVRDEKSRERLREMGVGGNSPVYPDLAFALDLSHYNVSEASPSSEIIGINPIACYDPRAWPKKDLSAYEHYIAELATFCVQLIEQNYRLSMLPSEINMDRPVIEDLTEAMKIKGIRENSGQVLYPEVESVGDLMRGLSDCRAIVGSRFHGVLMPLLLPKPVLALSYHLKVDTLMEIHGLSQFRLHIDDFDHERLMAVFRDLMANENAVIDSTMRQLQENRARLAEQFEIAFRAVGLNTRPKRVAAK